MTTDVNEVSYKETFKSVIRDKLTKNESQLNSLLKNFPTKEDHFQDYGFILDLFRNYSDLLFEKSLTSNTVSNFLIDKNHDELYLYNTLHFYIYGAGGVTSWLLPQLIKTLYAFSKKFNEREIKAKIVLFDGDTVENKNILRQNFILEDVGKNKAQVLSDRYNELYPNIEVKYVPKYICDSQALALFEKQSEFCEDNADLIEKDMFLDIRSNIDFNNFSIIHINLVDNELTKHMIDYYLYHRDYNNFNIYSRYFSAGCDINSGHVFTTNIGLNPSPYIFNFEEFTWKQEDADSIHQETTYSCAEISENLTIEQTFNSNSFAATLLNNLIDSFISDPYSFDVKKVKFVCGALPTMAVKDREEKHLQSLISLLARVVQSYSSKYDYDFIITDSNKDKVEEFQSKVRYLESKYFA